MGFLSCFGPVFSSSSRSSANTLYGEEEEKEEKRQLHHMVTTSDDDETSERLYSLRRSMKDHQLDVYVIPTADSHNSEYVGDCDKRRAWISGFTGSAGIAIVPQTGKAHLFTDSRYYVQAKKQLNQREWELERVGQEGVKNWVEWVLDLPKGTKIGIDASLIDYGTAKSLLKSISERNLDLIFPSTNLVDEIWTDRPLRSAKSIKLHSIEFAGKSSKDKVRELREYLKKKEFPSSSSNEDDHEDASSFLLTSLAPIAWLLNLRGQDIDFNPMFFSYLLIKPDEIILWVQRDAVPEQVRNYVVEELGGRIGEYEEFFDEERGLKREVQRGKGKIVSDNKVNWKIVQVIGEENLEIVKTSPIETAQAIKNEVEIEGFRRAYLRDGAAWARWAGWLEEEVKHGKKVTEWQAAEKLTEYRSKNEHFAGLAYENISASGENAALPHYAPSPSHPIVISRKTPYLNDSGAQYLDGTIDTTRTMHFGSPTKEQKRAFTRVLQGHIAIDRLVFPEGTTGATIDVLARSPLWKEGMNYGHGTGHGVGEYLSVHETQIGISGSLAYFNTPFVPGHVTSNEPAYYEPGSYGIRLESVLGVKEVKTRRDFGDRKWLGFERFTTVPIEPRLVDYSLLSREEAKWLRDHNKECSEKLLPLVKGDKRAFRWIANQVKNCR